MIYLIEGKETYFLTRKKSALLNRKDLDRENILVIDGSDRKNFSMSSVLSFCNTVSLFSERRAVVINDPYFLNSAGSDKAKTKTAPVSELLEAYCRDPNPDCDLLLVCTGFEADKRTKEYKILESHRGQSVDILTFSQKSPRELERYIDTELSKHKIRMTNDARREFRIRINNSTTMFHIAMDSILLYGEKDLNLEDIEHLVYINPEVNHWKLGNCFIAGDAEGTFRALQECIEIEHMTYTNLIPVLASQIRGIYNSVLCNEHGMGEDQIRRYTGRNYPSLDINSAGRLSSRDLLERMYALAELEQAIKRGEADEKNGFEHYLMRYL